MTLYLALGLGLVGVAAATFGVIQLGFVVERFLSKKYPIWVGRCPTPPMPEPPPPRCVLRSKPFGKRPETLIGAK